MRILLAGASGFLGTRLVARLRADGHDTVQLVRRPAPGPAEFTWSPSSGQLDPAAFAGVSAVINLAGAGVGDKRWTDSYKALIRSSRVDSTSTLATAIAALPAADRPSVLLNSSAVGWYGDTGDQPVEENAPAGEGFLSDVARVWEAATGPAEDAGVRVVRLRTGLPLHHDGGLLKPQLLPFRLGVGGKLGSGRQWVPWIALADWLAAVSFLLERDDIAGPVNVVGPTPVTNAAFGKALGAAVHRPAIMPIPALALQVALGEFAVEALRSTRVLPGVLNQAGFDFQYPDLPQALQAALHDS
ncbi:TIGR01777 family oxidoreductase [Micromonospora sp. NBC_01813]|uniref:TIGR01777 family oxidoreductase n=1 Tax=Micromonospora sp. NBC_01813 TaxID=2975988 RepID=UPI002DD9995C|nr:TIGR01777 family oxidoreductase [Micromonospora sp. NBC_01813]WSA09533.1 TIGR01777 family oxidoreductase [Micromonospora sp. NBC_01813]